MRRKLLGVEIAAWSSGLLCSIALFVFHVEGNWTAQAARRIAPAAAKRTLADSQDEPDPSRLHGVIARLDIPALGLSVPVLNDYDPASLRKGVGRIQGTALPGGLGNFVVAGHRDTYFRPLRHIALGMKMDVATQNGSFHYIVDRTAVVQPSNLDVLDVGDRPGMTLITCYPFEYVGSAPQRFVVQAHLVSVAASH